MLDVPEQFLSNIRFELRGKLEDLGLEIDSTTPKSGGLQFESGF